MPHSGKLKLSEGEIAQIREAQKRIGNSALATRASISVSTIQRTLRGEGGYDALRSCLLAAARAVLAEGSGSAPAGAGAGSSKP